MKFFSSSPVESPVKEVALHVNMDCPGCERSVRKALSHVRGVDEVDIDREKQKVTVKGLVSKDQVLNRVRKKRKQAELLPAEPPTPPPLPPLPLFPQPEGEPGVPLDPVLLVPLQPAYVAQPSTSAPSYTYVYAAPSAPNVIVTSRPHEPPLDAFSDENANNCSIM